MSSFIAFLFIKPRVQNLHVIFWCLAAARTLSPASTVKHWPPFVIVTLYGMYLFYL